jgi:hypothetical protein
MTAKNFVMPGLVPGIHVFAAIIQEKTWMAGTSPAMTVERWANGRHGKRKLKEIVRLRSIKLSRL